MASLDVRLGRRWPMWAAGAGVAAGASIALSVLGGGEALAATPGTCASNGSGGTSAVSVTLATDASNTNVLAVSGGTLTFTSDGSAVTCSLTNGGLMSVASEGSLVITGSPTSNLTVDLSGGLLSPTTVVPTVSSGLASLTVNHVGVTAATTTVANTSVTQPTATVLSFSGSQPTAGYEVSAVGDPGSLTLDASTSTAALSLRAGSGTDVLKAGTGTDTLTGGGTGTTVDLGAVNNALTVSAGGIVSGSSDLLSNFGAIAGSKTHATTFQATGAYSAVGQSGSDVITFGPTSTAVTITSVPSATSVGGSAGSTSFSGIATLSGSGTTNTLSLAGLLVPSVLNVSGATVGGVPADTLTVGGADVAFGTSFSSFTGGLGGTTFAVSDSQSVTLTGTGPTTVNVPTAGGASTSVTLSSGTFGGGVGGQVGSVTLAGVTNLVDQNLTTLILTVGGKVSTTAGVVVTVSGGSASITGSALHVFDGPTGRPVTFVAGGTGGFTYNGGTGTSNVLDLSGITTDSSDTLLVSAGSVANGSGTALTAGDGFTNIASVIGSTTGYTTYSASASAPAGFTGQGSGNVLSLTSAPTAVKVAVSASSSSGVSGTATATGMSLSFGDVSVVTDATRTSGDEVDLSGISTGATVNSGTPSVVITGGPTVALASAFNIFDATGSGVTTFVASATGGQTFRGRSGQSDVVDLTSVPGTATIDPTNNQVTSTAAGFGPDTVTTVLSWTGPTAGGTNFVVPASGGYTFTSQGSTADKLIGGDLGPGTKIDLHGSKITGLAGGLPDTLVNGTGFGVVTGPTGGGLTVVVPSTGSVTFQGGSPSAADTLDLTWLTGPLTIAVTAGSGNVAGNSFSGVTGFVGASNGSTAFGAPSSGVYTFTGQGAGNVLNLSGATSAPKVSASSTSASGVGGTATAGALTVTFSGVGTLADGTRSSGDELDLAGISTGATVNATGSSTTANVGVTGGPAVSLSAAFTIFDATGGGLTTFVADAAGGQTFKGRAGQSDVVDLGAVPISATINPSLISGQVSSTAGAFSADTVTGVLAWIGSSAGHTTFVLPAAGGYTFTAQGGFSNVLNGINLLSGAKVDLQLDTVTGLSGGLPDTLVAPAFYSEVVGPAGGGLTVVARTSTSLTVLGGAPTSPDTLDLGALGSGLVVDPTAGQVTAGLATITFSGVTSFAGSSAGGTTFVAPATGSYSFTGRGAGDTLALGSNWSAPTVVVSGTQETVGLGGQLGSAGNLSIGFTGISSFTVATTATGITGHGTFDLGLVGSGAVVDLTAGGPAAVSALGQIVHTDPLFTVFDAAHSGATTFLAGPTGGYTFTGAVGQPDSVSAASLTGTVTIDLDAGQLTSSALTTPDHFTSIAAVTGPSDPTALTSVVLGPAGGIAVTVNNGAHNTLDARFVGTGVTIDLNKGQVSGLGGTTTVDALAGTFSAVEGSTAGATTLVVSPTAVTFSSSTTNNTLDLGALASGLVVDPSSGHVTSGSVTITFGGVSTFDGSSAGGTTFVVPSTGSSTVVGRGAGNTVALGSGWSAPDIAVSGTQGSNGVGGQLGSGG
ncbi:MAG TPA: hypothetical protein VFH50_00090, partial [Acidimicrobiales bacterium]|nr:hypothetical protein [Acidimicrobiales bacterium]